MKKILYFASMMLTLAAISCTKDDAGGTATQETAGEWYVYVDAVDADGNVVDDNYVFEDLGIANGPAIVRTYNTAANVADKMYISDISYVSESVYMGGYYGEFTFFGFCVPIDVNASAKTFQTASGAFVESIAANYDYDYYGIAEFCTAKVLNGVITPNGGTQNNGSVADTIEFDLYLQNDFNQCYYNAVYSAYFPTTEVYADYGVDHFHVKGVRYSGLAEND